MKEIIYFFRTHGSKVHKRLSNEVGKAFLVGSGSSLLAKADKRKRTQLPEAVEGLWVRPSCEYLELRSESSPGHKGLNESRRLFCLESHKVYVAKQAIEKDPPL